MRRNQKIIVTTLWAAAVLGMLSLLASGMLNRSRGTVGADSPSGLDVLFDAPAFSVTDQNLARVNNETMRGKVWVASLFFTECPGICPMMTARLKDLQRSVDAAGVEFVSVSVDPMRDTPDRMRAYASKAQIDGARWHFVTGTEPQMFALARGLKLGLEPSHDNVPITHSQKALLIDGAGHVRGQYDTQDEAEMKKLAADATTLAAESQP